MSQRREDVIAEVVGTMAQASGRRLTVALDGAIDPGIIRAAVLTGGVERIVPPSEPCDLALVWWTDVERLERIGYTATAAVLLFDPREVPPVAMRRAARRAYVDHQAYVLPLLGEGACSEGLIVCSSTFNAAMPRISATMPVNMEEHDVERVLASFLPACEEWVVGVDLKSTDGTFGIVSRYADVCFRFAIEPWSFAEARNRGIDRCSSPWVFMTEGHEHLEPESMGSLPFLGRIGMEAGTIQIHRDTGGSAGADGQLFCVPSIFRNHPAFRFWDTNGVHNVLETEKYGPAIGFAGATNFRPPGVIRTFHKAHPVNRGIRAVQREAMNPTALDAYADGKGERKGRALFYAAQEHLAAGRPRVAVRRLLAYLREDDAFHEQVYEAHAMLADVLISMKKYRLAIAIAKRGLPFNLQRVEMDVILADAHQMIGDLETARQLYAKAAGVPLPSFSVLFLRKEWYRALPWRGLAAMCARLGEWPKAVNAARVCLSFTPDDEVARSVLDAAGEAA